MEINHSLIFCNSLFTFEKRTLMSLCSKNRFESSAETIAFNKLEALWRSFTYIKNNIVTRIDSCSTSHVTFCSFVLLSILMQIYYILLSICYVISKPGKICTRNPIDFKLFQKYCMIDCIKRLWKVDKNAKGVVVVLKWFVDLICKLSNSNWTWPF